MMVMLQSLLQGEECRSCPSSAVQKEQGFSYYISTKSIDAEAKKALGTIYPCVRADVVVTMVTVTVE